MTLLEGVSVGQGRDDIRTALVHLVLQGAIASDFPTVFPAWKPAVGHHTRVIGVVTREYVTRWMLTRRSQLVVGTQIDTDEKKQADVGISAASSPHFITTNLTY